MTLNNLKKAVLFGLGSGSFLWLLGFPTISWGSSEIDFVWCVGCMSFASILVDTLKGKR